MNVSEMLMDLVSKKIITLAQARMILRDLLWHESFSTTELYLDFRGKMGTVYGAINSYGEQLQKWIDKARGYIGDSSE